jgi:hypothetical protein
VTSPYSGIDVRLHPPTAFEASASAWIAAIPGWRIDLTFTHGDTTAMTVSAEPDGEHKLWPPGAPRPRMSSTLLRSIPIGAVEAKARRLLREYLLRTAEVAAAGVVDEDCNTIPGTEDIAWITMARAWRDELKRRPGRRGRPDEYYAFVAWLYAKAATHTRTPRKELADLLCVSQSQIDNLLNEARVKRRLLTETTAGRAGGTLTPRGQALADTFIGSLSDRIAAVIEEGDDDGSR